jgi:hypothetical protein
MGVLEITISASALALKDSQRSRKWGKLPISRRHGNHMKLRRPRVRVEDERGKIPYPSFNLKKWLN